MASDRDILFPLPANKLPPQITSIPLSTLTAVLFAVIVIAGLYLGREVLVPVALAVLLSFRRDMRAYG